MEKLTEFAQNWLNAWSERNIDQILSFYTTDCFYLDPSRPQGLTGEEAFRAYLEKLLKAYPSWEWLPVEIIPTTKGFTCKWKAKFNLSDDSIEIYGLDIVELQDNKISRNEVYFDTSRLLMRKKA